MEKQSEKTEQEAIFPKPLFESLNLLASAEREMPCRHRIPKCLKVSAVYFDGTLKTGLRVERFTRMGFRVLMDSEVEQACRAEGKPIPQDTSCALVIMMFNFGTGYYEQFIEAEPFWALREVDGRFSPVPVEDFEKIWFSDMSKEDIEKVKELGYYEAVLGYERINGKEEAVAVFPLDGKDPASGAHNLYGVAIRDFAEGTIEVQTIRFQDGPIKEVGVNGIQIEHLLLIARHRLEDLQSGPYPCIENAGAIEGIISALDQLNARTLRRQAAQIEGTNVEEQEEPSNVIPFYTGKTLNVEPGVDTEGEVPSE